MNLNDIKPLHPLSHGNILIVGAKASNFEQGIIDNPRVILWSSQNENWMHKDLPQNVRAVFMTRFIGHSSFAKIMKEARKKNITVFNVDGTGNIARQVKELLDLNRMKEETMTEPIIETRTSNPTKTKRNGLKPLIPFLDPTKNHAENARFLLEKAKELGISTTFNSLAMFAHKHHKRQVKPDYIHKIRVPKQARTQDVSVEILDNMIKELQDMRDYLVAVTDENQKLKARIEKFKKFLSD